jgi:transposase-like protein
MCAGKNGVSAHELHRQLGVTLKTAWFIAHRVRYAMTQSPLAEKLSGTVEADETYIGGKVRNRHGGNTGRSLRTKTPVVTLVERNGDARSAVVPNVNSMNIARVLWRNVDNDATLMTDEWSAYKYPGRKFAAHHTVKHKAREYVRGEVYTNTVEGFFSQLKRSIDGTHHAVSRHHLHRYLAEFDYRYNTRKISDGQRTAQTISQAAGKRLTYSSVSPPE